jgi:D-glycero-alpha-D-manno-heptose-7-phosphate kinase
MIIARSPLRISIGGGGTDLPSYYKRYGGFLIAAAINRYIFLGINRTFTDDYFLKYSTLERVKTIDKIRHPIIREALRLHDVAPPIEMVSLADIPSGTGLGSSGSFTVGVLRAIYAYKRQYASAQTLAEEACHVELDVLERPGGKQDQYVAAFGGLICLEFEQSGAVHVSPLNVSDEMTMHLEDHLLMFFTGYSRSSETLLQDQTVRTDQNDSAMVENLHVVKQLGLAIKDALEKGNATEFGRLMHEHWLHKRTRSPGISNSCIDQWYALGLANGAVGGKLIGAGGGGFLVFYAKDRRTLRKVMAEQGLQEVRYRFDHDGASVMARD